MRGGWNINDRQELIFDNYDIKIIHKLFKEGYNIQYIVDELNINKRRTQKATLMVSDEIKKLINLRIRRENAIRESEYRKRAAGMVTGVVMDAEKEKIRIPTRLITSKRNTSKIATLVEPTPPVETTQLVESVTPSANTNQTTGKKWFYSLFNKGKKGKVEDNYSL